MSQRDAPAFDFYPERWLVGTAAMSDAEQLSYLRLLCHQWTMDGLPEDATILRRLGGKGVTDVVLDKFPPVDGKRRNARLEIIRGEQRARIAKSRDKIEKMNAARAAARSSTREPTTPILAASSPLTTHHPPHVLLEKEPKGAKAQSPEEQLPKPESVRLPESLPRELHESWSEWQAYRQRRAIARGKDKLAWTYQAARMGAGQVAAYTATYGARIVCARIASAIGGNWQGLNLDKLEARSGQGNFARPETTVPHSPNTQNPLGF